MSEAVICKQIKCKDYLIGEGEPVWCYRAGQPAQIAVLKCPKAAEGKPEKTAVEKQNESNNN
jgi:hypothetical protein